MCLESLNGILKKGLSNSFYYMYSQILKNNMLVNSNQGKRNITLQRQMLSDPVLLQIIDTKAKVLDPALNELKKRSFDSVVSYI